MPGSETPLSTRLRRGRHLARLSEASSDRLARAARVVHLDEGEYLFRAGEPAEFFAVMETGLVLISVPKRDGESAILGLFGPRECVGLSAALDAGSTFPGNAMILSSKATAILVPAADTRQIGAEDTTCASALREALLDHTRALRVKIEILSAGRVRSRLASLLLHLAERFGDELEDGDTFVPIALSRSALAQLISARSETVIRALTKWRHEGLVIASDEGFRIKDPETLRSIAEGS